MILSKRGLGKRRQARELALQNLFYIEARHLRRSEITDYLFYVQEEFSREVREFAERLVVGVRDHLEAIDQHIEQRLENWTVPRLSPVDRNILRMAVFEILECDDIPEKVTLNEAIELAKAYGDEKSSLFVNGVLDAFLQGEQTPLTPKK